MSSTRIRRAGNVNQGALNKDVRDHSTAFSHGCFEQASFMNDGSTADLSITRSTATSWRDVGGVLVVKDIPNQDRYFALRQNLWLFALGQVVTIIVAICVFIRFAGENFGYIRGHADALKLRWCLEEAQTRHVCECQRQLHSLWKKANLPGKSSESGYPYAK